VRIALIMQTGATLTQYFAGPRIRLAFAPLPLLGAGVILYTLITGHHAR
jgi:hypothetical protein